MLTCRKFSLISIDGPIGSDYYSRRDIIDYRPEVLADDFAILIHDSERKGEKRTISDIAKKLDENNIGYSIGEYTSLVNCCVIVSKNLGFLCSM